MSTLKKIMFGFIAFYLGFLVAVNIEYDYADNKIKPSKRIREFIWVTLDDDKYDYLLDNYLDDIIEYCNVKNFDNKIVFFNEESLRYGYTNGDTIYINTYTSDNEWHPEQSIINTLVHEMTHVNQREREDYDPSQYTPYSSDDVDSYLESPYEHEARINADNYIKNYYLKGVKYGCN